MHLFLKLFILVKHSTCFGLSDHHQELKTATYSIRHMSNSCCYILLAGTIWNLQLISFPLAIVMPGYEYETFSAFPIAGTKVFRTLRYHTMIMINRRCHQPKALGKNQLGNAAFLLLPTWYTNFLFIHINYIKLNSSTCFERNPPIIRRSTT
jgi:hypothetical protein